LPAAIETLLRAVRPTEWIWRRREIETLRGLGLANRL
jgi:hypothetical protein